MRRMPCSSRSLRFYRSRFPNRHCRRALPGHRRGSADSQALTWSAATCRLGGGTAMAPERAGPYQLAVFRTEKRRLLELWKEGAYGGDAIRDAFAVLAAWLAEANDCIPRLLAGAPPVENDTGAFAVRAMEEARSRDPVEVAGRFRRSADRYETMLAE